jgi:hypothetical protein
VTPLPRAHAHNDYEHSHPLRDALSHGFCSVEADVWLVNGRLLVAHDLSDVNPERTLEKLYLDPLRERVREHRGRVYPNGPTVTLLIDVKSEATNSYRALRQVLGEYSEMLTRFHPDRTETNAVTVIVSGNRARVMMANDAVRLAAFDGRLEDLASGVSPHFIPLVSDNWSRHFKWRARADEGPISAAEKARLLEVVRRAHEQGRRLRWWGAPDNRAAWDELAAAGVDLINTDDLAGLQKAMTSDRRRP